MPPPGTSAAATLNNLREIQNYNYPQSTPSATAPDYCLGAARFTAGKLVGILDRVQHVNGFLSSKEAKSCQLSRADLARAWGKLDATSKANFDKKVLMSAVEWGGQRKITRKVEFLQFLNGVDRADSLLRQTIPLVTGISLSEGSRDHFVVVVCDDAAAVWVVDSWGETGPQSSVSLPTPFSFSKPAKVSINAGDAIVPCAIPWFGYFVEEKTPLKRSIPF